MIRQSVSRAMILLLLAGAGAACTSTQAGNATLDRQHQAALWAAIAAPTRTPANIARDRYRHPVETLSFFGVEPDDTVVEIWPGAGWYTEILAPYVLQGGGTYYAAANGNGLNGARSRMTQNPGVYGGIRLASFPTGREGATEPRVPDGSADVVLTFRNVHNWMMGETPFAEEAFRQMFAMLRPGGTLGVVDHRLPESADSARERTSGYLKTSTVRRLAEAAGFRLVAESEINANPNDTTDHPSGVWTLPPSLRLGDQDRDRYLAIGESDRMTLRFVKPE
ncbi:MAG TPA: methyltransferase type 11 [Allosphingosinicella sp.]|nr:methyltransferase type 11 [Allosphingosinicella sp.]